MVMIRPFHFGLANVRFIQEQRFMRDVLQLPSLRREKAAVALV